jgi:hypothetical protein
MLHLIMFCSDQLIELNLTYEDMKVRADQKLKKINISATTEVPCRLKQATPRTPQLNLQSAPRTPTTLPNQLLTQSRLGCNEAQCHHTPLLVKLLVEIMGVMICNESTRHLGTLVRAGK